MSGVTQHIKKQYAVFAKTKSTAVFVATKKIYAVYSKGEQGIPGSAANFLSEVPAGVINGVNATFTLTQTPGTLFILTLNGLRQNEGAGNDFTKSGTTITFNAGAIPLTGDVLNATYNY